MKRLALLLLVLAGPALADTYYLSAVAVGSNGTLTTVAPAGSTTSTGWSYSDTTPITQNGATYGSACTMNSTCPASPGPTNGGAWQVGPLSGTFASGTWTVTMSIRGSAGIGNTVDLGPCVRLASGTNSSGTGATDLTTTTCATSATWSGSTATTNTFTITFSSVASLPLTNGYLFLVTDLGLTNNGFTSAGQSFGVNVAVGSTASKVVSPTFTAAGGGGTTSRRTMTGVGI